MRVSVRVKEDDATVIEPCSQCLVLDTVFETGYFEFLTEASLGSGRLERGNVYAAEFLVLEALEL